MGLTKKQISIKTSSGQYSIHIANQGINISGISEFIGEREIIFIYDSNLDKQKNDVNSFIYHAGTELIEDKLYAIGGRVLNFVSISDNLKDSRDKVIKKIEDLGWKNGFYRKDIGYKIINK